MPADTAGVDKVIVVDVEDRDDSAWRELTPFKGGLSGWKLLWDRICPFQGLRCVAVSAFAHCATSPLSCPLSCIRWLTSLHNHHYARKTACCMCACLGQYLVSVQVKKVNGTHSACSKSTGWLYLLPR